MVEYAYNPKTQLLRQEDCVLGYKVPRFILPYCIKTYCDKGKKEFRKKVEM